MSIIHFSKVGRDKKSWTAEIKNPSNSAIAKEAKRGGWLMSREVDVEMNDDCSAGVVIVGGWRKVGSFTIERKPAANPQALKATH
jgi:hypothetical protein